MLNRRGGGARFDQFVGEIQQLPRAEGLLKCAAPGKLQQPLRIGRCRHVEDWQVESAVRKQLRLVSDQQREAVLRVIEQTEGTLGFGLLHRESISNQDSFDQPPNQRIFYNKDASAV